MKAFGIPFSHRRPQDDVLAGKDYAQFYAFAALCDSMGVARHVRSVFFDTKWQGFNLDVDPAVEHSIAHATIQRCAEATLPQADLFGQIVGKSYGEESGG